MHWYTFTDRGWQYPVYERTFPTEAYALKWLSRQKWPGFTMCDSLPPRYFY